MATTTRELSPKINNAGESEIIIRLSVARGIQPRIKTGIHIAPFRFKNGVITRPRANRKEAEHLLKIEDAVTRVERFLLGLCSGTPRELLTRNFIEEQLRNYLHPELRQLEKSRNKFFATFDEYLDTHPMSQTLINNARVLYRALKRYEMYTSTIGEPYTFTLDNLTSADITRIEHFLRNEVRIYEAYPELYTAMPADTHQKRKSPRPQPRGDNSIVVMFKRLRMFYRWCNKRGYTDNDPFSKYDGVKSEKYGTPYYISPEERASIADFDLSRTPAMEAQRDIFIFQCLVGCRVSDLLRLTPANVIAGGLEYIPTKTKGETPSAVRVPLHRRALAIIDKYKNTSNGRLLPFISSQRYNDYIKRIFTVCGIDRIVTVLNPTTGEEEQRPLNEIASSHLARRTFIGTLYSRIKDPEIIGKLSGHKEGSRAFARYRDIDEGIKKEVINLLGE